jgi:transcriptional regulator with XRE-family HTH domain
MSKRAVRNGQKVKSDAGIGSTAKARAWRGLEQSLGNKIRAVRQGQGFSMRELASAAGISSPTLSRLEHGRIAPSLATLVAIARALQVPISSLFGNLDLQQQSCCLVPAGHGVRVERKGDKRQVIQRLGVWRLKDVVVEPYLVELGERTQYADDSHRADIEFNYVLRGELHYRCKTHAYHLKEGDSLLFESGVLHGPSNSADVAALYLAILVYASS